MNYLIPFSLAAASLPCVFQIIYGNKSVAKKINLRFRAVCLISMAAQFAFAFLGLWLVFLDLKTSGEIVWRTPAIGFLGINVILLFIMFVIMGIQFYVNVSHQNKLDSNEN